MNWLLKLAAVVTTGAFVCWWISGCWWINVALPVTGLSTVTVSCGSNIRDGFVVTPAVVPVCTLLLLLLSSVPFTTTTLLPLVRFFIKLFCCNRVAILLWLLQYINRRSLFALLPGPNTSS